MSVLRISFFVGFVGLVGLATATDQLRALYPRAAKAAPPVPHVSATTLPPVGGLVETIPVASRDINQSELTQVLAEWATTYDVEGLTLAIAESGNLVASLSFGTRDAARAYPIASLSKAITAICMNGVLADHGLTWSARLDDLRDAFAHVHITVPTEATSLTLADIVTHTAGFRPDLTQGDMARRTHGSAGLHIRYAFKALSADGMQGIPGAFFYSNTNYAVLGAVIEGLENRPYEAVCTERALEPTGATTAKLNGRVGSMSSFAGWEMSAEDYALFYAYWFAPWRAWMLPETNFPRAFDYGLGVAHPPTGGATHQGRLCHDDPDLSFGALAESLSSGVSWAANWTGCLPPEAYSALKALMAKAL